jgi:AcrR family transcriptional regulator
MTAEQLLLPVQLTARLSALLFAGALAVPVLTGRPARALYPAFLIAHTVHFGFVAALAVVGGGAGLFPGGRSLEDVGGWPTLAAIATLFYAAALGGLARGPSGWRRGGHAAAAFIGFMFVATYLPLVERSAWYALPAAIVTLAVGLDLSTLRRSRGAPCALRPTRCESSGMARRSNPDDPRVRRTVLALREALVALVAERDYQTVTVTDLVERAGLHRATFYRHFDDKDELLRGWGLEISALLEDQASGAEALTISADAIPPLVTAVFEHIDQQRLFYRLMTGRRPIPSVARDLERRVAAFLNRHGGAVLGPGLPAGPPRGMLGSAWAAFFVGAVRWWLTYAPEADGRRVAEWIWRDPYHPVGAP